MELIHTAVELVLSVSLMVTLFAYGMRADKDDFLFFRSEYRLLFISLISIFVLAPVIAIALYEWLDPPLAVRVAIASMSISIIPPLLPWKQLQKKGNSQYAIGLTMIVACLAILVVPAAADLLGRVSNHPYEVPPGEIAGYVLEIVLLPTILGFAVGNRWSGFAERFSAPLARLAGIALLISTVVILATTLPDFPSLIEFRTLLTLVLFNVIALGVGHLLGGPTPAHSVVLALSTSARHPAIALTVASITYPGERVTAAVMLCVMINMLLTTPYLRWQAKKHVEPAG